MVFRWSARALFALSLFAIGCGDDVGPPPTDAGADADAMRDAALVVLPAPPAAPNLTPCFEGFTETEFRSGLSVCEPWPTGAPDACASFEAHFAGRPGCERVGTACESDGFPSGLASTGVVYVSSGAADGDGTRDAPFGSIGEAITAAAAGNTIAIGVGTYREEVIVDRPLSLVGACVEGTTLHSDAETLTAGVITVESGGVTIENLQIGESERSGVWIEGAYDVTIRDVVIDRAKMIGIDAERGASVDISRVAIRDIARAAIAPVVGYFGRGLNVESGAAATVDTLFVSGAAEFGVLALTEGSTIDLSRVAIVDTVGREDGTGGVGLMALDGGVLRASGAVVSGAREFAVGAINAGSRVELTDAVMRGTRAQASGALGGRAFNLQTGASGSCTRCLMRDNLEATVFVSSGGATLTDTIIASTRVLAVAGRALEVSMGADVVGERLLINDASETGMIAGGPGTRLTIRDLEVSDIAPLPETGVLGRGITVQAGAWVELDRARIEDVVEHGIVVSSGELVASDLSIRRVLPATSDGYFGRGIAVQIEGVMRGDRVDIEETYDLGFLLLIDSRAELRDLRVVGTRVATCATSGCLIPSGHGVGVYDASATIEGLLLEGHEVCGIHIAAEGVATLSSGLVAGNAIGACVQSDVQEVSALQRDVDYVDNGLNLESTDLPIPEPVALDL